MTKYETTVQPGPPTIIAHRGASLTQPENTIAAFDAALAGGADAIELDVRWTADEVAVIYHDPAITHHEQKIPLRKLTVAELTAAKRSAGITIPTLTEVLRWAAGKTPLIFDIKDTGREDELIAEVERHGFHEQSIFSSFRLTVIGKIKARRPDWMTAWIIGNSGWSLLRRVLLRPVLTRAVRWGAGTLHFHHSWITAGLLKRCREADLHVAVWTVDQPADIRIFRDLGVDAIITNAPEMARRTVTTGSAMPGR